MGLLVPYVKHIHYSDRGLVVTEHPGWQQKGKLKLGICFTTHLSKVTGFKSIAKCGAQGQEK